MNKLVLIFDYFKEAFHINKKNKSLYAPQIALIAVRVLLFLFAGIGVYSWIGVESITSMTAMRPEEILGFVFRYGFRLLAILLAYALISVVVESGLLNMYKKAVTQGYTKAGDFREGLSKYFLKLLLGELFIILFYILALPFYLILGIVTLTVGLTAIPIVTEVFFTMWKVSLVMNDIGIFESIKDSFRFAKRNFIPLTVLQVIHWSFNYAAGGGGRANFNIPNSNGFGEGFGNSYNGVPGVEEVVRIIKLVITILLPIASIAIIAASLIAMIFEVFFALALFIAYNNDFQIEIKQPVVIEEPVDAIVELLPEALEAKAGIAEEAPISEELNGPNNEEESNKEVE
ncbi:MAG: hypothetical protein A2Y23_10085 [Clostridiales bacterium GWB2_37_7]|nr:MAG: hypothetical protein A2Y23_10085 [Clostridiales bacterium GWB2_37_7]